jgi:hypothetical protein
MTNRDYQSLQTVRKVGKLPAVGSLFCNGLSNRYESRPPSILKEILSTQELQKFALYMDQLNYKTAQYWPCLFAYWCGYLCAPCTVGLSLCLPRLCVAEAEAVLLQELKKINQDILEVRKLEIQLVKECCDSYLLIEEVDFARFEPSCNEL